MAAAPTAKPRQHHINTISTPYQNHITQELTPATRSGNDEVFGKCLDGIASGLITVMSRADFPVGERYPAGTTDKLMADFLKYHEVPGLSKVLPYPQKEVDKNQKPQPVGDHPPLRRIGNI